MYKNNNDRLSFKSTWPQGSPKKNTKLLFSLQEHNF